MAELAGFDVVCQVHRETIVDLVNAMPVTNPAGGQIRLFGGRFTTDLAVPLGPLGTATVRAMVELRLEPVIHQPTANVVIAVSGGTTAVRGTPLGPIGGTATVAAPIGFAMPPGSDQQFPALQLGAMMATIQLDRATHTSVDAALGPGSADFLSVGLSGALSGWLATIGAVPVAAMPFKVVPGVDSHDPGQLSALPTVAWIDATTLGVFGYYRADAASGDVTRKPSDLAQPHEEFFYGQPGLSSVLPGRRVAVLVSAMPSSR
jgi:hypothetical protein